MRMSNVPVLLRNDAVHIERHADSVRLPRDEAPRYTRIVTRDAAPRAHAAKPLPDEILQPTEWWAYESEFKQRVALEVLMRRMFEVN